MPRTENRLVAVITGASSGIGRAAAFAFAREGHSVVLAARNDVALEDVAREVRDLAAEALAVPTDVTYEQDVRTLAARAREAFGGIDVWVNNAAVSLFARFEDAPSHMWRQVIETNLFGYVHGARAVLPIFRQQEHGILIMNSSVVGLTGQAYVSAYATAKFAIRGFSASLRQELLGSGIHVCDLLPASIDTPFFQHAANLTGRAIKPVEPITNVEEVAEAILSLAHRPRRELVVGRGSRVASLSARLAPGLSERATRKAVEEDQLLEQFAPPTQGNLYVPLIGIAQAHGGWREQARPVRRRARAVLPTLAFAAAGAVAWRQLRKRRG